MLQKTGNSNLSEDMVLEILAVVQFISDKLRDPEIAYKLDSGEGLNNIQHVEVPIPTPSKDEVLLKLEATSLNPVDWKIQKGMVRPLLPRKFPCITKRVSCEVKFSTV